MQTNVGFSKYASEPVLSGTQHAQATFIAKYEGRSSISAHLRGKISWLGHVKGYSDPIYRSLALRFNHCFPELHFTLQPTVVERRDRAVWIVEQEMSQGSDFFLRSIGLVTAWHCVDGTGEIEIYHHSKPANKFKVSVNKSCKHRDLCILDYTLPATEFYELEPSPKDPEVEDRVTAVGFPDYGPGDKQSVRSGTVSSLPVKRAVNLLEVTQQLDHGMSGGPVLNDDNMVVGIVHKGGHEEKRNLAVHLSELRKWLSE